MRSILTLLAVILVQAVGISSNPQERIVQTVNNRNTMKKTYNYILMSALAFMAVGCIGEGLEPDMPVTGSGNDVKFGLSFDESKTRTIYGPEDTKDNVFPIYWSNGDKVLVASPQCAVTSAEYEVIPVTGQSYAEAMNKVSAAGIQWGSSETADFFSVYPSKGAEWVSLVEGDVTAKLNIASEQSANYVLSDNVYIAADMQNVIMYAQTNDVSNGSTVDLRYKPYSTTLEFELNIGNIVDNQGNPVKDNEGNLQYGSAKIMSLTLTAPVGTDITGDFSLEFNGANAPTIEAVDNNGNSIAMHFTTYPMLDETNQTLKVKMAMIPLSGVTIEDWYFEVEYLDGDDTATTTKGKTLNIDSELKPGMIHKIKMPVFPTKKAAWDPAMDKWISSLYDYKNIYLTELSIPGAWYAGAPTSDGYQSTADIPTLWNAGVRAFAVECRTSSTNTGAWYNPTYTPSSVVISGTQTNGILGIGEFCTDGTPISTVISSVASSIKNTEFGVLILSYADGGDHGHRAQDHAYFINGIKNEIAKSGATNIYAEEITPETIVDDVLGKLIIKINVDDHSDIGQYDGKMNALLSYNPFMKDLSSDAYSTPLFSKLYWQTWKDEYRTTTTNGTDFLWCFSSANRTQVNTGTDTTIPSYSQRQTSLREMIVHSKGITAAEAHNVWFYFNAGGTQTTSQTSGTTSATNFAQTMNPWLLDLVKLKANGGTDTNGVYGTAGAYVESDPSPLGVVMFNQCTNSTYKGPEIIAEIVHMNNKFKLLRKPEIDPDNPDEEEVPGDDE